MNTKYDVALSFAKEDRPYVEEVAETLKNKGIKVFYDRYEQVELWGKNLYSQLNEIYQNDSNFTIIFISKNYIKNIWANHELECAQARSLSEKREYILPVRIDDTEIPSIISTIAHIDIRNEAAQVLCEKIIENNRKNKQFK